MAAEKPEVVISSFLVEIVEKFQRLAICFHARPFQWTGQQYSPTSPSAHKSKMAAEKTEVVIFSLLGTHGTEQTELLSVVGSNP